MNPYETLIFKLMLRILKKGWGYCEERSGEIPFSQGQCPGCDASDIQDWIKRHLK
jgi:hypothetical protein